MKKILLFVLFPLVVLGQKVPYEKLDSLSREISRHQFSANDLSCTKNGEFTVTFPEESFTVFAHSRKAQNIVYRKTADKEIIEFTEDIDLSRITALTIEECSKELRMVRLHFPPASVKTTEYENGKIIGTRQHDKLDLYIKHAYDREKEAFSWDMLFTNLTDLSMDLRIEKGQMSRKDADQERQDNLALTSKEFLAKYPKSILAEQAHQNVAEQIQRAQAFIDQFSAEHDFHSGANYESFAKKFPRILKVTAVPHSYEGKPTNIFNLGKAGTTFNTTASFSQEDNSLVTLSKIYKVSNGTVAQEIEKLIRKIKSEVSSDYWTAEKKDRIVFEVTGPDNSRTVAVYYDQDPNYPDYYGIFITAK